MATAKIVQVPMEDELRQQLDKLSQAEGKTRSEVIREACRQHLRRSAIERLDRQYEEGYRRLPENPAIAEAMTAMAAQLWKREFGDEDDWDEIYQQWLADHSEATRER